MSRNLTPNHWRKSKRLTLAAAASLAGIGGKNPSRTWQRWERGENDPPISVIVAIEGASKGKVSVHSWAQVRSVFLLSRNKNLIKGT